MRCKFFGLNCLLEDCFSCWVIFSAWLFFRICYYRIWSLLGFFPFCRSFARFVFSWWGVDFGNLTRIAIYCHVYYTYPSEYWIHHSTFSQFILCLCFLLWYQSMVRGSANTRPSIQSCLNTLLSHPAIVNKPKQAHQQDENAQSPQL